MNIAIGIMKRRILMIMMGIMVLFAVVSCDDDDSGSKPFSKEVRDAFEARFPGATAVEWGITGDFYKADFVLNGEKCETWFTNRGEWLMTEADLTYANLPEKVKTAFVSSLYSNWSVENIDKLERLNMPILYQLDLKKGSSNIDIYFDETGDLVRTANEEGSETLPSSITSFIKQNYSSAVRVGTDHLTDGMWVVDLLDEGRVKEVFFSRAYDWMRTQWTVPIDRLPEAVMQTLSGTAFEGYTLKGAEYRKYASGSEVYRVRLVKTGSVDMYVEIHPNGQLELE